MPLDDYTPHQQKIIKRYYDNAGAIHTQRLAELATELYLTSGKKRLTLWKQAAAAMEKLGVSKAAIDRIVAKDDPAAVANIVKDLMDRPG